MDQNTQAGSARRQRRERFFVAVADTLELLRTPASGLTGDALLDAVAQALVRALDLPMVWIGSAGPADSAVRFRAAAGSARDYMHGLRIGTAADDPQGSGPAGQALRSGRPMLARVHDPIFAPWRARAMEHGLRAALTAVAGSEDGTRWLLALYTAEDDWVDEDLIGWAQRLAVELAHTHTHTQLQRREQRLRGYRDALATIQTALLSQPDPQAIAHTLADALVQVAGAAAVDVFMDEGEPTLRRMTVAGPLSEALLALPRPPRAAEGTRVPTPSEAFASGQVVIRRHPATHPRMPEGWQQPPLVEMGAVGCWPIFGSSDLDQEGLRDRSASGVFAVIVDEADTFDEALCALLDQIANAAGLALRQHAQRQALLHERERQTHLALHDALTGLPNRRALEHHLEGALARARRHHQTLAIGLLDLDDFKPINDHLGHAAGDRLLMQVAERLQAALRADDYVARQGGDEFVLVLEDLASSGDLEALLDRVQQALQQPMTLEHGTQVLRASLGVALYPQHGSDSAEQLLRRADQAMYLVKSHKHEAHRWWSLPPLEDDAPQPASSQFDWTDIAPYGESAARLLERFTPAASTELDRVVESFYLELALIPESARLLQALPEDELHHLHKVQATHLRMLLQPPLSAAHHHEVAARAGRVHAGCGVEAVWLTDASERLREALDAALARHLRRDRRVLLLLHRRLAQDRQWQLEGMRSSEAERAAALARISALAWSAESYPALMQQVVEVLASLDEVAAATVGRPDAQQTFTYEAVAGAPFIAYLRELDAGSAAPIRSAADSPLGRGPGGRAWQNGRTERCTHYATDPAMAPWREKALQLGVRSSIAIPLANAHGTPLALLTLYCPYPGGYGSDGQQAFVAQLKTLLDLALERLAPGGGVGNVLPYSVRERWRARLAGDGVEMHFQPLIALHTGRVVELEALARLRDADGALLAPASFLPALGDADLLRLFQAGLRQSLAQRAHLLSAGHTLDVAVNLPPAALHDARYAQSTLEALAGSGSPPHVLLLELLEDASRSEHALDAALTGLHAFKSLGVRMVEDDLGAGHSSLARLRQWPFDRVKIDQALVRDAARDPLRTLRFIRQLTQLGHALGIEVVVEGLETPGMVEAALILGADLGQGYALARPMPADALSPWLTAFRWTYAAHKPRTALGALAGLLLWDETLRSGGDDPLLWQRLSENTCLVQAFLDACPRHLDPLDAPHRALHAAARQGPQDAGYQQALAHFTRALVQCVRGEETGAD